MNISLVKPWHPKVSQLRNVCRAGVISVAMFALLGCFGGSTVKQSIDDYAARLSRVLDTPLPDSFNDKITTPLPKLADSATLKQAIEGVNINLREFYALQDCELGTVVAERNTSLGKSQLPSQRLVYESKLLNIQYFSQNNQRDPYQEEDQSYYRILHRLVIKINIVYSKTTTIL